MIWFTLNYPCAMSKFKRKTPRRIKRMQLNVKYRWRGMAKTNYRKLNKRLRGKMIENLNTGVIK